MTTPSRAPFLTAAVVTAFAIGAAVLAAPTWASGPTPPTTDPDGSDAPATTAEPAGTYEFGVFTAPDRSFTANFDHAPAQSVDEGSGVVTFLSGAEEDSQSVVLFPPTALGATAESTAAERTALFLAASGSDIEDLANTPTNLGPYPASHFAARLTLADARRATVYGVLAYRGTDVAYAFYTDIGDDDNAGATSFVQSFAIVMSAPPRPTTVPDATAASTDPEGSTTATAPTTAASTTAVPDASTTPAAPTTTSTPPPSTVAEAPDGALLGFDGRWWITFPSGAAPSFRASTDDGFAYAQYLAVDRDDTCIVRVTEVPPGYEWDAALVPEAAAARVGAEVLESSVVDVAGRPATRFRLAQDDSDTSGDSVHVVVVNDGDQIYSIEFWDGGTTSTGAAIEFIDSFDLA